MHSKYQIFFLIAVANIGRVRAHEPPFSPQNLLKRIVYGPPPGPLGWDNPDIYTAVFPKNSPAPDAGKKGAGDQGRQDSQAFHGGGGGHELHNQENKQATHQDKNQENHAQNYNTQEQTTTGGDDNKQCGKSSAQCPHGCQMTIRFTSDSMAVPFTPGAGGHSDQDTTQDSCICMTAGSVRVNVGTTDTSEHTTLIEGLAAGLNDDSYFDVSYVEGYNYPVVCWNDHDHSRMSGHNVDLYESGKCTSSEASKMGDICENDGYQKLVTGQKCWECTLPSVFFAPASGAAYTYPADDCPCASYPQPGQKYQSPMATGGEITCCVGPNCCANTMSHGGQTRKGNCNRPDCRPCDAGFDWGQCTAPCAGQPHSKRDYDRVLELQSLRKRQKHQHHHYHHHHDNH